MLHVCDSFVVFQSAVQTKVITRKVLFAILRLLIPLHNIDLTLFNKNFYENFFFL